MSTETEFKSIPLKSIIPDPDQPRKMFDESAMAELTASVKEKGVLQPVLVRPKGKKYRLVYGERRYMAAKEAGLSEIPSIIRTLNDAEALEIQIVENLQRHGVHPMEEGVAFKSLQKKFKIEEIATRVGKSGSYVAGRIKLTDLIETFQEMLFLDRITLTEALKLCRLPAASQKEILKGVSVPKDWKKKKEWQLNNLRWVLNGYDHDLDSAPFKTEDANLYPKAGACNKCQHNSASNPLLFPELQKKRICHNSVCFGIKSQLAYKKTLESVAEKTDTLLIVNTSFVDSEDREKIKVAEEMGAPILNSDQFEILTDPQPPVPYEEFRKEYDDEIYDEDEIKSDYEQELSEYQEEQKKITDARMGGRLKEAFIVAGDGQGTVTTVILKINNINEDGQILDANLEIDRLQAKEARNKEIDREKVYKQVTEVLRQHDAFFDNGNDFSTAEWDAIAMFMFDFSGGDTSEWFRKKIGFDRHEYQGIKRYKKISANQQLSLIRSLIRRVLLDKLVTATELDRERFGKAAAIYNIAKEYIPDIVEAREADQKKKADIRIGNVKKRIAALQQPAETE